MRGHKTPIALLLLMLFLLQQVSYVLFMGYAKNSKSAFRSYALNSNMEKTVFYFAPDQLFKNRNGFEWKEEGKELVVRNIFYEIISISKCHGLIKLITVEDSKENNLFSFFFKFQKKNRKTLHYLFQLMHGLHYLNEAHDPLLVNISEPMLYHKSGDDNYRRDYVNALLKPPCCLHV